MNNRRSYLLIGVTVFMVGVAMRTIPLYWSYLPFNLDGLQFAAPARYTLSHGHLPFSHGYFHPDKYVFTVLLTICSQLTGISPLRIAQPMIAVIGSVPSLIAVWLTRRLGRQLRWRPNVVRVAAALAGLVLATEGIYLGRSAAVTSEGAGLVFVAVLAIVFYQMVQTGRPSWVVLTILIISLFPLTHNLSTMIGALVITALLALSLGQTTKRVVLAGGFAVAGFWLYLSGYYSIMGMSEFSRVASLPGLFLAWLLVLIVVAIWLPSTSTRAQRGVPTFALLGGVGILVANFFVPVFPGTAALQPSALLFTLPIVVGGFLATRGLPYITMTKDGAIVLAILLGPLALIGFALTGDLTFKYQGIAVRSQIFIHLAAAVLAALAVVDIGLRGRSRRKYWNIVRTSFVPLLLIFAVVSAPVAFAGLRATPAKAVIAPNEFEATTFAVTHIPNTWVSDGHITRLASYYYPLQTNSTDTVLYQWLRGGDPPACPVVSQQSWTTVGAQLFPASPEQVKSTRYQTMLRKRNVIYSASGDDSLLISSSVTNQQNNC